MRTLALITMVLGWLVYSAMSAWAGCPTCASMNAPATVESGSMHGHEMAGMDMHEGIGKTTPAKDPCASGNAAHMPLCAACLLLPPTVIVMGDGKSVFGYPQPPLVRALDDNRPAPQAPPPRLG